MNSVEIKSVLENLFQNYQDNNISKTELPERISNLKIAENSISFDFFFDGMNVAQKWQTIKMIEAQIKEGLSQPLIEVAIYPKQKQGGSEASAKVAEGIPLNSKSSEGSSQKSSKLGDAGAQGKQAPKHDHQHHDHHHDHHHHDQHASMNKSKSNPEPKAAGETGKPGAGASALRQVPGVKKIIAVGSGKGGVGKSTVALNLALSLSKAGLQTGLLDADFYGPSQTILLGTSESPEITADKKIKPVKRFGIQFMSFGFFLQSDQPAIWRGPMLQTALRQFFFDVLWEDIDVLVVDLPPGTGDVPLSLCQLVALDGAILVSTPQDVALSDTVKGLQMFKKLNIPILGMVENMSTFICPNCQHGTDIFGHGGVEQKAQKLEVNFLGSIPLEYEVRLAADQGIPILFGEKTMNSASAKAFESIADHLMPALQIIPKKKGFFSWFRGES